MQKTNEFPGDEILRNAAAESLLRVGRLYGCAGELHEEPGLVWFTTCIPFGDYNGVLATDLTDEMLSDRVRAVEEEFRRRRLSFVWTVDHRSRPADLGVRLLEWGYRGGESLVSMGASLRSLPPVRPVLENCDLLEVQTPRELAWWLEAARKSFGIPGALMSDLQLLELRIGIGGSYRRWVAMKEGEPLACASLLIDGLPGIYFVGVAPEARRGGLGYAMTRAAMEAAREGGHDTVVLQASALGEPLYRQMGFRAVGLIAQYERDLNDG